MDFTDSVSWWMFGPTVSAHCGSGLRGPHGLGPLVVPLRFVTTSLPPSGVMSTSVGYQAVGMKPRTLRLDTSITSTAFSPASATYNGGPAGLTAEPSGVAPTRWPFDSPTCRVAATRSRFESITDTVSLFASATYIWSRAGL